MKSLQDHLRQYVAARRALGTQLREPAKTLRGFIQFLGRKKSKFITIPLALEWSQQSKNVQRATWARKLSMVRQFARWLSVIEPRHQVPPPRLLNVRHRRNKPHIYSDQEIAAVDGSGGCPEIPPRDEGADPWHLDWSACGYWIASRRSPRRWKIRMSISKLEFWSFESRSSASLDSCRFTSRSLRRWANTPESAIAPSPFRAVQPFLSQIVARRWTSVPSEGGSAKSPDLAA